MMRLRVLICWSRDLLFLEKEKILIIPVVLAGGSGTRLWPLSREFYPKQMLDLTGEHTMLQNTILRLGSFDGLGAPMIIGSAAQRFLVRQQMAAARIKPVGIFLEPFGRNTAPAVAVAALKAGEIDPDAVLLVLPADHLIRDVRKFHQALKTGAGFAREGFLVTFGIVPDRPETGYGYIRRGELANPLLQDPSGDLDPAYVIEQFVEKPDLETARNYLESGIYCWNSGMFMFSARHVLEALRRYVPDIVRACGKSLENGHPDQEFFHLDADAFKRCPSDSIDYAVMEKTDRGLMIPLDVGWDDLGSWESLWNVGEKDADGNVISGDVLCVDVKNTLVNARSRLVTLLGVRGLAVVETPDALLVASLSSTQGVKKIVDALKAKGRKETRIHTKVILSWGDAEVLDRGGAFKVRRVTVLPGATLCSDGHQADAVSWTALGGQARLTVGGKVMAWTVPQSVCLEPGNPIRLENSGPNPLTFIEVVSGPDGGTEYLGITSGHRHS